MTESFAEPTAYVGIGQAADGMWRLASATGGDERSYPLTTVAELVSRQPDLIAVCADAADLARRTAVPGPESGRARAALLRLAREGRLVCLAAARHVADTARHPQLAVPDEVTAPVPDDPAAIAAIGQRVVGFLTAPVRARWLPQSAPVTLRAGPLGLAVRAQVVCGLVGPGGIRADPKTVPDAVESCRRVADDEFRRLVGYPGAADCFKGGRNAGPDGRGFRTTRPAPLGRWLGGVADAVLDRWGVPVPRKDLADGWPDRQLRNWPVWGLGAEPLTRLCDLQAAEYLHDQLARAPGSVPCPTYTALPRLSAAGPDLFAYRRLRAAGRLPAVFVPRDGHAFVRVALDDLPVRALAAALERARPGGRLARELRAGARAGEVLAAVLVEVVGLSPAQAECVAVLTATGVGTKAVAVLAGWLAGVGLPDGTVRDLDRRLQNEFPELRDHTAERAADQVARSMDANADELRGWIEFDPAAAERGEGFLRQFSASGLAERWGHMSPTQRVEFARRCRSLSDQTRAPHERPPLDPQQLRELIDRASHHFAEPIETPTGRAFAGLGWVPARAAFLGAAEDAFAEAVFAVLEAGHQVSALGRYEIVLEVAEPDVERAISELLGLVRQTAGDALGGFPVEVEAEELARW